jgi:hypothetical protein
MELERVAKRGRRITKRGGAGEEFSSPLLLSLSKKVPLN